MIKIILMIIALSCTKNINDLRDMSKGINEDLIKYSEEGNKEKILELLNKGADVNFKDSQGNTALFHAIKCNWEEGVQILLDAGADVNIKNANDVDPLFCSFFYSNPNLINKSNLMKKLIKYGANVNAKYDNGHSLLISAVCRNEIKVVKLLLESGVNINAKSKISDCTPLMEAIRQGYLRIIDILLKAGANCTNEEKEKIDQLIKERNDINFVNEKGETALSLAVENEELELAKSLIEKGANINVKDNFGYTPFAKAVFSANKKMIKLFLDNGVDINEEIEGNESALLVALERGNSKLAKFLIECGAIVEEASENEKTALMYAAKNNCIEIAKILIENKTNTSDFSEALNSAALFGHLEIIKLLWEKIEDLKGHSEKVLLEASFRGYTNIIRWLIEREVDINIEFSIKDYTDYRYHSTTPLITASQRVDIIETAKLLIEKGADVNKKDSSNFTPLMSAAKNGNLELVKLFLELGADINIEDNNGETALSYAVKNNHKEIEKLILEKNIYNEDINVKNTKGVTLLMQAATIGDRETMNVLISKGADVNEKDSSSMTALMYASMNGHLEVVKILSECGADINEKSSIGYTPLIYSIINGHLEVLNFLLEKDANITSRDIDTPMAWNWNKYSAVAEHNYSPLYYVAFKGYLEILKVLVDKFENLNLEFRYNGGTILVVAISYGHTKVAKFLIEKGARINGIHKHDSRELTVFSVALEKRNLEILKLLVEKGVDISSLDMNALIDAMERTAELLKIVRNTKLVKPFIDIVIYIKDQNGKSMLTYLSEKIKNYKEKEKKDKFIEIVYMIIKKMAEDYIELFISMNKNSNTSQEAKDEVNNHINMLYSLQKLPIELFVEIITRF